MFARLLLLFVLVPLVELVLLVRLGQAVGLAPTLGLVLATGVVGAWLARAQGLRTLARFRSEMAAGRVPQGPLFDGLLVLVGGAFLLTPGLLTDLACFLLLVPLTRGWLKRRVSAAIERSVASGQLRVTVLDPGVPAGSAGPFGAWTDADPELTSRQEIDGTPQD
jgi:UPF0716 protein FxsA